MRPLSLDLRERIVAAYEANEGSHEQIGKRFAVSGRVVGKLVQQKKTLGTLKPQTHRRGRKPAISGETLEKLKKHVADSPDATAQERLDALDLQCTLKTVYETLHRIGYSFKKNRRGRPNKTVPTLLPKERTGGPRNQPSIRNDWYFSMKQVSKRI